MVNISEVQGLYELATKDYVWVLRHVRLAPTHVWLSKDETRIGDAYEAVRARRPWKHSYSLNNVISYVKAAPTLSKDFLDVFVTLNKAKATDANYLLKLSLQFRNPCRE
jgi:hypothetical protein